MVVLDDEDSSDEESPTRNENKGTTKQYNLPRKRKVKLARKIKKNSVQKRKADSDNGTTDDGAAAAPAPAVDSQRPALHSISPNVATIPSTKRVCMRSHNSPVSRMTRKPMCWSSSPNFDGGDR
jgi:hypothetical protein